MVSEERLKSWQRTREFLHDARSHFTQAAESKCSDRFRDFDEYLQHNELELALDMLDSAFRRSQQESCRVLKSLAFVAANMGLVDRQREYDRLISAVTGSDYETVLPPKPA